MLFPQTLNHLLDHHDLSTTEAESLMTSLMQGELEPAQIGALLAALRSKGETVDELTGLAQGMREHSLKVPTDLPVLDTCGTGGDGAGTINISTAVMFVLAAAGVPIAKHGNRSVSSQSGSADLLDRFGVVIDLPPAQVGVCLKTLGVGFMFAPRFHPAMRHVMPARRALGVRTVFNLLGPLTNPASAKRQVLGVFSADWTEPLARVLQSLGSERALVVHGGGLDELALHAPSQISELRDGEIHTYQLSPEEVGLQPAPLEALRGGTPEENARLVQTLLQGNRSGPMADVVALNAGAGLYLANQSPSIAEGVQQAQAILSQGSAWHKVEAFAQLTQQLTQEPSA